MFEKWPCYSILFYHQSKNDKKLLRQENKWLKNVGGSCEKDMSLKMFSKMQIQIIIITFGLLIRDHIKKIVMVFMLISF